MCALAERIILRQRPVPAGVGRNYWSEERNQWGLEPEVTDRKVELLVDRLEHGATGVDESEPAVSNLHQSAVIPEPHSGRTREELTGELPWTLLRVQAAGER
ncbi:hypothetical protein FTUN_0724 [Frigoriglobus tundricola]|uniref:Uncharacterized protein n=1 Tax=Frigoriglobus tundricola TaxID=2774151 RepID=A0A6M5YGQ0_9BACT|nr:hypothetical protein FTUN_0724 [Frigoriglobus tundricola]